MGSRKSFLLAISAALCVMAGCSDSKNESVSCENGAKKCEANNVMECQSNEWAKITECTGGQTCDEKTFTCEVRTVDGGKCSEVGTFKCDSDKTAYKCTERGWEKIKTCGADERCNSVTGACDKSACTGDQCTEKPKICEDGAKKCEANKVMECQSNAWTTLIECTGELKCEDETFKCAPVNGSEIRLCDEDAIQCKPDNASYKCTNNEWVKIRTCGADETCNTSTGACDKPECTSNKCKDDDTLIECQKGKKKEIRCENNKICSDSHGGCVEQAETQDLSCPLSDNTTILKDGESTCDNGKYVTCDAGELQKEDCLDGKICHNGENACALSKACTVGGKTLQSGDTVCDQNKVVLCNDGTPEDKEICEAGKSCMLGDKGYQCDTPASSSCTIGDATVNVGGKGCDGNVLKTCTEAGPDTGVDCSTNGEHKSLCKLGECVAKPCDNGMNSGDRSCNSEGTQIVECVDGEIKPMTGDGACTSEQVCVSGDTPSCVSNKKYTTIRSINLDFKSIAGGNAPDSCMNEGKELSQMTRANVTVSGVVTAVKSNGFFVQDPKVTTAKNGGIFVNCRTVNCTTTGFDKKVSVDDNVKVTANYVGYNYCQLWIRGDENEMIAVEKTSADKKIKFVPVAIKDIKSGVHNAYNGSLVNVSGVSIDEGGCEDNLCTIVDSSGSKIQISNYIYTSTVNTIKKKLADGVKQFDLTGIVYYNKDIPASALAPVPGQITDYYCSGTEKKCEDNMAYVCSNGQWGNGTACSTNVENAVSVCNQDAKECTFKCKDGFHDENGVCVKNDASKKSCEEPDGTKVPHGGYGCRDNEHSGVKCNDGNWEPEGGHECRTSDHGQSVCRNNRCFLNCDIDDGYVYSSTAPYCQKNEEEEFVEGEDCWSYDDKLVKNRETGCVHPELMAECYDGEWVDLEPCAYGDAKYVQNAESFCSDNKCQLACDEKEYTLRADGQACIPKVDADKTCEGGQLAGSWECGDKKRYQCLYYEVLGGYKMVQVGEECDFGCNEATVSCFCETPEETKDYEYEDLVTDAIEPGDFGCYEEYGYSYCGVLDGDWVDDEEVVDWCADGCYDNDCFND